MTTFIPIGKNTESACKAHHYRQTLALRLASDNAVDAVFAETKGTPEWTAAVKVYVAAENALAAHIARWEAIEGRPYPA